MADEKQTGENKHPQHDLKNPKDRDALKRAADEMLKTRKKAQPEEEAEDAAFAADSAVIEEGAELKNEVLRLTADNAELKNQLLRLAADMENLRRRTQRDVTDAKTYAIANFARDMLVVADNFSRALAAIPPEARENDPNVKALSEGVEMTERAMMAAMERHGVKKIATEGQKFDPNFHQAMFEVHDTTVPNNTVTQVVQAGYTIGERVLRPAMVGVTKGGAKTESPADKD